MLSSFNGSTTKVEWHLQRSFFVNQTEPILSPLISLKNDESTQLALSLFVGYLNGQQKRLYGVVLKATNQAQKMLHFKMHIKCSTGNGQQVYYEKIADKDHEFNAIGDKWEMDFTNGDYAATVNSFNHEGYTSTICCEIEDLNQIQLYAQIDPNIIFRQQLWESCKNGDKTDVTIRVEDKEFKAHQIILTSQSEVFKTMLSNPNFKESQENLIEIDDFDSDGVEKFIEWMYLGKVKEFESQVENLFSLADKYQVIQLKDECSDELFDSLNDENLVQRFIVSILHDYDELKNHIIELILEKTSLEIANFFLLPEWIDFVGKYVDLAKDVKKMFEQRME